MTRSLEELRQYLVGEWLFNGDFKDSSGNGNHGTPTNVEWNPTSRGMKPYFTDSMLSIYAPQCKLQEFTYHTKFIHNDVERVHLISESRGGYLSRGFELYIRDTGSLTVCITNDSQTQSVITSLSDYIGKETDVIFVLSVDKLKLYVNGQLMAETDRTIGDILYHNTEFILGQFNPPSYPYTLKGFMYVSSFHSTALSDSEAELLYNSTKHAYGIVPAERSFSHNIGDVLGVPEGAVFCTDMSTMDAEGKLIDLSGNNNHGTVNGVGRASGYFRDGLQFDGVDDYVNCGNDESLEQECFFLTTILQCLPAAGYPTIFIKQLSGNNRNYQLYLHDGLLSLAYSTSGVSAQRLTRTTRIDDNKYHIVQCGRSADNISMYIDGVLTDYTLTSPVPDTQTSNVLIGFISDSFKGNLVYASMSTERDVTVFNKLAALQLYTFDFSKVPVLTGLTSVIPYSSAVINSGEFNIVAGENGNQLVCVSTGQMQLRCAHEFDGSEYLTVSANAIATSGTGSVTAGTMTAALSQGSTAITLNMAAGDTLDTLDVQFREQVE